VSSSNLLSDAVGVSQAQNKHNAFWDRLFVRWFDQLVYPLIWEDPISDLSVMGDIRDQHLVCLTSGGCNILSYLTQQPASITAVDLNETHLALLALKKTVIAQGDYQDLFELFAQGNVAENESRLQKFKQHMPEFAQNYWFGRKRSAAWFNTGFYHRGLLGRFIGIGHWLAKTLGHDLSIVMQAKNRAEAEQLFDEKIAPLFDRSIVRWLSGQVWVLYGLGIPPRQYEVLLGEHTHMADVLKDRLRHLACDFDLHDNYFAWQAFARRFNVSDQAALPLYLQARYYATLQTQIDSVNLVHQSVTEHLATREDASIDVYVLLDAQDWMNRDQLIALWQEINRTAKPGARVIFRAAGAESPLTTQLPDILLAHWHTDADENRAFWQQDRSAIYGGCFVYRYQ